MRNCLEKVFLFFQICKELADKHDRVRAEYWKYMGRILDNVAKDQSIPSDCN